MYRLGDYVRAYSYYTNYRDLMLNNYSYGKISGKIVGIEKNKDSLTYTIRYGHGDSDKVFVKDYDSELIEDPAEMLDLSGKISVSEHDLRQAFAQALKVADATGWKTGEAIIEELFKNK